MGYLPRNGSAPDRPRCGSMILTSSIAGLRGLVGVAHYTAAKHGVVGLMRSLAKELAPHNIRVNTVHPTNVDTPMIQNDSCARRVPTRPRTRHPRAVRRGGALDEHARRSRGSNRSTSPTRACFSPPTRPATSPRSRCRSTRAAPSADARPSREQERQHGGSRTPPWPRSSPSVRSWGTRAVRRWEWCASGSAPCPAG